MTRVIAAANTTASSVDRIRNAEAIMEWAKRDRETGVSELALDQMHQAAHVLSSLDGLPVSRQVRIHIDTARDLITDASVNSLVMRQYVPAPVLPTQEFGPHAAALANHVKASHDARVAAEAAAARKARIAARKAARKARIAAAEQAMDDAIQAAIAAAQNAKALKKQARKAIRIASRARRGA